MPVLIIAFMLLLTGCGGPMIFDKPGAAQTELQNDSFDCRQQWDSSSAGIAFRLDPINNVHAASQARGWTQACMERKGWRRVQ